MTNQEAKRAAQPEAVPQSVASLPTPPVAIRKAEEHVIHGDVRRDDYGWLRNKSDSAVIAYLSEENAYTDAVMKGTGQLQESLYQEMLGRILQTDLSVPYRLRGYDYLTRTEEGKQYPMHARRAVGAAGSESAADNASEELLLDLNVLAEGHSFLGLGSFDVSDDNNLLAYSIDVTGFRQYTLYVKSLRTGETFAERIERVTSTAWAADNHAIFYTVEDETTKRSHRLYRHLVAANEPDILLYEEKDERFRIEVERTRSGAYLILTSASHTTSEVRYLAADDSLGTFRLMAPREEEHEYYVEHHPTGSASATGGEFYIRTNSGGRTFRLMKAPVEDCGRENWREIIPNRPKVMLSGVDVFATHVVLTEREQGLPHLRVAQIPSDDLLRNSYRLEFSEPAYNAALGANPEFQTGHLRFTYESFVTPRSVFDFDLRTRERLLRKQQPVLGGYDPARYASERIHAKAADGTLIPISLVYRRDALRKVPQAATDSGNAHASGDGSAPPLLLYGYGSYGISIPISFSSNRLSLLDRGIIFAIAHIRGGGELGKPWHDAGRMHKKLNTFTDFISAGEFLISEGYAARDRLIIEGGSAGGLLMGAVTNLRPDLFRLVISHVPFVDVLNTMLDASLPLTVGEYEEWGNPQAAEDYFYIRGYCPYTNLRAGKYPTMLLKTGLNDSQVMYWEPAKYVAKLRAIKTDGNSLLLKTNMGAGHGGASGRYDYLREIAFDYAFILTQMQLTQAGHQA
jgi:oligopeptidase B